MERFLKKIWVFLFVIILINGCKEEEPEPEPEPEDKIPASVIAINKFVYENMDLYYLWRDKMPVLDYKKQPDTFDYFDSLLYKTYDRWSFITDDYESLAASYQGIEVSTGFSFELYKYLNSDGVYGVVRFVFANSPASEAGLKRGDFFTAIDGTDLDINNYNTLLDKTAFALTVAELRGNTIYPKHVVNLTARKINENPLLVIDTLIRENIVIGYVAYKNFYENYNDSLNKAFSWLRSAGAKELILDLRYNNGGDLDAMRRMASLIAPQVNVTRKDIIIKDQYNTVLQKILQDEGYQTTTNFDNSVSVNLNLSRIYILTGPSTASASEALIIGLEPYMNVVTVGEQTHGKYTGAFLIYDTEKKHNWAIQPIVFKYANVAGFTDFPDGLVPKIEGEDDLLNPLGSIKEELVAKAVSQITGKPYAIAKSAVITTGSIKIGEFDNNKPPKTIPLLKPNPIAGR